MGTRQYTKQRVAVATTGNIDEYIQNQEEHHKKTTSEEEHIKLSRLHNVKYGTGMCLVNKACSYAATAADVHGAYHTPRSTSGLASLLLHAGLSLLLWLPPL